MYNPSHPGEILREEVIDVLGLSVTEAARRLGMSRVALSRVLNGKAGISPDLAIRLERAGVATARAWLQMQANYDLWQAMQHEQPPRASAGRTCTSVSDRSALEPNLALGRRWGISAVPRFILPSGRRISGQDAGILILLMGEGCDARFGRRDDGSEGRARVGRCTRAPGCGAGGTGGEAGGGGALAG